ncbi:N-terminal C2 in EEIG1 and EHBP1 proteins-domain-containing protein [Aspergillus pseudonomiae]|nr:N-terminal C2 in EEIG1 and EHBP1 proteins-domain-containing protein [Aspergillus pseudonomiae]
MQAFVPKNRRPRFELGLRIIDLNNVPLVNGTAFVKWRLPSSSGAENHGHTDKAVIIDHRAYWSYEKTLPVRLTIDRNQSLHECDLQFEIIQEFESGGGSDTKNFLGRIRLNLAEYVDKSDDDEGIVRRYLMQDSKVNSTLKIGVSMRQVDGDRNFTTPPLKSAMVFGGITGIVSAEQTDPDDLGPLPSINMQSRETADMQDMYRRTLAASCNSRSDDTPADKLVEDLFSGSISWSNEVYGLQSAAAKEDDRLPSTGAATKSTAANRLSPSFERRPKSSSSNQFRSGGKLPEFSSRVGHSRKRSSIEHQLYGTAKGNAWKNRSNDHELSEFDVREDLRSWEIGVKD